MSRYAADATQIANRKLLKPLVTKIEKKRAKAASSNKQPRLLTKKSKPRTISAEKLRRRRQYEREWIEDHGGDIPDTHGRFDEDDLYSMLFQCMGGVHHDDVVERTTISRFSNVPIVAQPIGAVKDEIILYVNSVTRTPSVHDIHDHLRSKGIETTKKYIRRVVNSLKLTIPS